MFHLQQGWYRPGQHVSARAGSQQRKSKLISVYLPSSSCTGYFVSYYPKVRRYGELEERGVVSQRSSLVLRLSFWCIHDMVAKTKQELHGGESGALWDSGRLENLPSCFAADTLLFLRLARLVSRIKS